MAQLAYAVGGAIIGDYAAPEGFMGMSGASLGWMGGAMLYGALQPGANFQGPKIGDLKVTASGYGKGIPLLFGSMRSAGNIVWATPIVEHATTQSAGGGGKGGGDQSYTTYTYSCSFATSLCVGPIAGVRKIWANGNLIYNLGSTASIEEIIASNAKASGIKFYTGNETQLPDPTMEAHEGSGNVPAYRGQAYAVFTDMALADYGNRLPNLEFEVLTSGDFSSPTTYVYSLPHSAVGASEKIGGAYLAAGEEVGFPVYTLGTYPDYFPTIEEKAFAVALTGSPPQMSVLPVPTSHRAATSTGFTVHLAGVLANGKLVYISESMSILGDVDLVIINQPVGYDQFGNVVTDINQIFNQGLRGYGDDLTDVLLNAGETGRYLNGCCIVPGSNTVIMTTSGSPYANSDKWFLVSEELRTVIDSGVISAPVPYTQLYRGNNHNGGPSFGTAFEEDYHYGWSRDATTTRLFSINDSTKVMSTYSFPTYLTLVSNGTSFAHKGIYLIVSKTDIIVYSRIPTLLTSAVTIQSVLNSLVESSGLSSSRIDTSTITDTITGYGVGQQTSGRGALEQLLGAFDIDGVESGDKIKFIKRGTT